MKYSENTLNILTALTFKGIGNAAIHNNADIFRVNDVDIIIDRLREAKKNNEEITKDRFLQFKEYLRNKILSLGENCDGIISIYDENFPTPRGNVKDADKPCYLFYKGDITLLSKSNTNIAVIGLLDPDLTTENEERAIVKQLVDRNAVIVSGLARGCDAIAHEETLKQAGLTVAILPSPLNNITPKENIGLANQIVENGGLVITEYLTNPSHNKQYDSIQRFIRRDRLQALYSDCVLLSASYANNKDGDSGARHAMEKAYEYGIPRAVIYNKSYSANKKYDLNRQIIQIDNERSLIIDTAHPLDGLEKLFSRIEKFRLLDFQAKNIQRPQKAKQSDLGLEL